MRPVRAAVLLAWGAILLGSAPGCRRQPQEGGPVPERREPVAALSLHAFGRVQWRQSKDEPLLLTLTVSNLSAENAQDFNRRSEKVREASRAAGAVDSMTLEARARFDARLARRESPAIRLGESGRPASDWVRFDIRDSTGQPIAVPVRALALPPSKEGAVEIGADNPLVLHFALDPAAMAELPEGSYRVAATLDTTRERRMWAGEARSDDVRVELHRGPAAPAERTWRDYLGGRFDLLDGNFKGAEQRAARMLAADPGSIDALELRGDALSGQGRNAEAAQAFARALELSGKNGGESPEYVIRRLRETSGVKAQ